MEKMLLDDEKDSIYVFYAKSPIFIRKMRFLIEKSHFY